MKKLTGLCLAFMLVLSACTPSSQEAPAKFKAGSYSGSAKWNERRCCIGSDFK